MFTVMVHAVSDPIRRGIFDSIASILMVVVFAPFASEIYPPLTSTVIRLRSGDI